MQLHWKIFSIRKLVPKLWKGACVVMDNCPIHLGEEVKKAIDKKGAKLIYLSPYSPDFSPIENLWSKLKIILRSIKTTNYQVRKSHRVCARASYIFKYF